MFAMSPNEIVSILGKLGGPKSAESQWLVETPVGGQALIASGLHDYKRRSH